MGYAGDRILLGDFFFFFFFFWGAIYAKGGNIYVFLFDLLYSEPSLQRQHLFSKDVPIIMDLQL